MSGRRFLWRWSVRMLRREPRQHVVVLLLIVTAVALSIGAVVAAFNLATVPEHRFGTGQVRATVTGDSAGASASLADQGHPFGAIESLSVNQPGSQLKVQVRSQDPENEVSGPLLDLVSGRWPSAPNEIAVTNDAPVSATEIGATVDIADASFSVVGVVENPTDLDDEFVLSAHLDQFGVPVARRATLFLVDARPADVTFPAGTGGIQTESREAALDDRTQIAIAVNLASAVAMFEVALLVGAGFAVLARRRSRQYGLLGAAGGTPRQIRQLATATGVVIGVAGSIAGAVIGVVLARVLVPRMEVTVGHRIDFAVPWWSVLPTLGLAIATAGVAAWWPARSLSRQPIVSTLAALRPAPPSTTGSTTVGGVAIAVGSALLAVGAVQLTGLLMIVGIIVAMVGMMLLAPALIRLIGRRSSTLPLSGRMAGRAIARQQGRSAAVVAALTLALGIPVGIAVVTASIDDHNATKTANLSDNTAILWLPGVEQSQQAIPSELDPAAMADTVATVTALLPDARVAPIELAVGPDPVVSQVTYDRIGPTLAVVPVFGIRPAAESCLDICEENTLGDRDETGAEILVTFHDAWIATPELLDVLGLANGVKDRASGPSAQAISRHDDAKLSTHRDQSPRFPSNIETAADLPPFTSIAPTLIQPEMVTENQWHPRTVGWLVVNPTPIDGETMTAMTDAAGVGLLTEFVETPSPSTGIRAVGIAIGILIAFGIVASAVALLTSESADDLRILRSVGADPKTGRRLSASTAAMLALAGAVIAVPVGYLSLVVLMANPRGDYGFVVPWSSLLSVLVITPTVAAAIGWFMSRPRSSPAPGGPRSAALAVVAVLLLGACGSAEPDAGRAAGPFDASIGCDPTVDASLTAWAERGVGASIALVGGERQCVAAYGPADVTTGRANTTDTVFSIGSITKAVTAAGIYDLIDSGRLTLTDPVSRHVAGLGDEVGALTIRDLLLHTSGLTGEHGIDHQPLSETDAVTAISSLVLSFEAGADYSYTNAGYTLLALVIEAVTDEGFRQYLADNILVDRNGEPLGGFWDGEPAPVGPRAFGHNYDGTISPQQGRFEGPHWAMNGNGGIAMTAVEMAEWTWALFNGHVLSERGTELLTSTTTVLGQDGQATELAGWGLLPAKEFGEPVYATSGGGGSIGHLMNVGWLPESGRVIVIAENAADYDVPFFSGDIVPAILAGTGIPTPPIIAAADPDVIEAMVGRYEVGTGHLEVTERDGGLLVEAAGIDAVKAILPVPPSLSDLVARHEQHAAAFAAGETLEGRRFRDEIEAESGPILSTTVLGSAYEGELGTFVELQFEDSTRLLVAGFNLNGGTEYWSTDFWPVLWFVMGPDNGFEIYQRSESQPNVRLSPTDGGVEVDGPAGVDVLGRGR